MRKHGAKSYAWIQPMAIILTLPADKHFGHW